MNLATIIYSIIVFTLFWVMVLYVVFGQVTVRKFRKKPKTKNALGIEFASGWDILNVAGALALPRRLNKRLKGSQFPDLYADAELLDRHTNVFDRVIAVVFYTLFVFSAVSIIIMGILHALDIYG